MYNNTPNYITSRYNWFSFETCISGFFVSFIYFIICKTWYNYTSQFSNLYNTTTQTRMLQGRPGLFYRVIRSWSKKFVVKVSFVKDFFVKSLFVKFYGHYFTSKVSKLLTKNNDRKFDKKRFWRTSHLHILPYNISFL